LKWPREKKVKWSCKNKKSRNRKLEKNRKLICSDTEKDLCSKFPEIFFKTFFFSFDSISLHGSKTFSYSENETIYFWRVCICFFCLFVCLSVYDFFVCLFVCIYYFCLFVCLYLIFLVCLFVWLYLIFLFEHTKTQKYFVFVEWILRMEFLI
jgi:hypothetical protein